MVSSCYVFTETSIFYGGGGIVQIHQNNLTFRTIEYSIVCIWSFVCVCLVPSVLDVLLIQQVFHPSDDDLYMDSLLLFIQLITLIAIIWVESTSYLSYEQIWSRLSLFVHQEVLSCPFYAYSAYKTGSETEYFKKFIALVYSNIITGHSG